MRQEPDAVGYGVRCTFLENFDSTHCENHDKLNIKKFLKTDGAGCKRWVCLCGILISRQRDAREAAMLEAERRGGGARLLGLGGECPPVDGAGYLGASSLQDKAHRPSGQQWRSQN
jgi:hypothetical protein